VIGDDLWAGIPPDIFQATQPGHPFVGRCNEYWRRCQVSAGEETRVPSSAAEGAVTQSDGISRLKALAVNLRRSSGQQWGMLA